MIGINQPVFLGHLEPHIHGTLFITNIRQSINVCVYITVHIYMWSSDIIIAFQNSALILKCHIHLTNCHIAIHKTA